MLSNRATKHTRAWDECEVESSGKSLKQKHPRTSELDTTVVIARSPSSPIGSLDLSVEILPSSEKSVLFSAEELANRLSMISPRHFPASIHRQLDGRSEVRNVPEILPKVPLFGHCSICRNEEALITTAEARMEVLKFIQSAYTKLTNDTDVRNAYTGNMNAFRSIMENFQLDIFDSIMHNWIDMEEKHYESMKTYCLSKCQPSVRSHMRSVLVDWLIDVGVQYSGRFDDSFFRGIRFIDRFCRSQYVAVSDFQLLGAVCMSIASKMEDVYHIFDLREAVNYSNKSYSIAQAHWMESRILKTLNFEMEDVVPLHYLRLCALHAEAVAIHSLSLQKPRSNVVPRRTTESTYMPHFSSRPMSALSEHRSRLPPLCYFLLTASTTVTEFAGLRQSLQAAAVWLLQSLIVRLQKSLDAAARPGVADLDSRRITRRQAINSSGTGSDSSNDVGEDDTFGGHHIIQAILCELKDFFTVSISSSAGKTTRRNSQISKSKPSIIREESNLTILNDGILNIVNTFQWSSWTGPLLLSFDDNYLEKLNKVEKEILASKIEQNEGGRFFNSFSNNQFSNKSNCGSLSQLPISISSTECIHTLGSQYCVGESDLDRAFEICRSSATSLTYSSTPSSVKSSRTHSSTPQYTHDLHASKNVPDIEKYLLEETPGKSSVGSSSSTPSPSSNSTTSPTPNHYGNADEGDGGKEAKKTCRSLPLSEGAYTAVERKECEKRNRNARLTGKYGLDYLTLAQTLVSREEEVKNEGGHHTHAQFDRGMNDSKTLSGADNFDWYSLDSKFAEEESQPRHPDGGAKARQLSYKLHHDLAFFETMFSVNRIEAFRAAVRLFQALVAQGALGNLSSASELKSRINIQTYQTDEAPSADITSEDRNGGTNAHRIITGGVSKPPNPSSDMGSGTRPSTKTNYRAAYNAFSRKKGMDSHVSAVGLDSFPPLEYHLAFSALRLEIDWLHKQITNL